MDNKSYLLYIRSFVPTYIYREIYELLRRGLNVYVIKLGNSPRSNMWENITSFSGNGINKLPGDLVINNLAEVNESDSFHYAAEKIHRFLGDITIERIHSHFAKRESQIGLQLSKIRSIPFSVTTHARDIFVPMNIDELQYLLRETPRLFTISNFNKKYLGKYLSEKDTQKISVTYLGIDINNLTKRKKIHKNYFSIYCVASGLVEKKGVIYLLEACKILDQKGFEFKCSVIGSNINGKNLESFKAKVKEFGLQDKIDLPGIMPSEKVLQEIAECDVFVLPCVKAKDGDMDGIPVSLIEAMGIGVPVISTKVSGIPELIEHKKNGLLVEQKDSSAIADAVIYIFNNPGNSQIMEKAAQEIIKEKFSIEKYVDSLICNWGMD